MERIPEFIKASYDLHGLIEYSANVGGKNIDFFFKKIYAGLCWPWGSLPGYYCVVGEYPATTKESPEKYLLIHEKKFDHSHELMNDAMNTAKNMRFNVFYTDFQNSEWQSYIMSWMKLIRSRAEFSEIRLKNAHFGSDFRYGMDIIVRWGLDKKVSIPEKTMLMEEMKSLKPMDLDADVPAAKFCALNAFRYVVTTLNKQELDGIREQNFRQTEESDQSGPVKWA